LSFLICCNRKPQADPICLDEGQNRQQLYQELAQASAELRVRLRQEFEQSQQQQQPNPAAAVSCKSFNMIDFTIGLFRFSCFSL
jgi:hypothetical protein